MSARRTNLALLVLLVAAVLSGGLAFAAGTEAGRWIVIGHGVLGLALVALSPWKSVVVRRGLRRHLRTAAPGIALGVLAVLTVATGVAHAAGARRLGFGITVMQVHVGAALAAIPAGVWHVLARPVRPRRTDLSRRAALRAAGVLSMAGLAWIGLEGVWHGLGTAGARRRFTGSHEVGTGRPEAMPVTQWLDDTVPVLDASWRLTVADADGTRRLALRDLRTTATVVAALDCTGGWYAEQTWSGVPLAHLVRVGEGDRSVLVRSVTGYGRRLPVEDLDGLLLATSVGGSPLSDGHGFPARLVVPGRRGFWWVKWVSEIRVDAIPAWWQPPFPLT